jgi:hypothetical protein
VQRLARGLGGSFAILTLAWAALRAQTADPSALAAGWVRESWSIADGLPVNSINGLIQSRAGCIWAATEADGLFRIADDRAERISVAPAMERDSLFSLFEDREERLWIGAANGVWEIPKGSLAGIPTTGQDVCRAQRESAVRPVAVALRNHQLRVDDQSDPGLAVPATPSPFAPTVHTCPFYSNDRAPLHR